MPDSSTVCNTKLNDRESSSSSNAAVEYKRQFARNLVSPLPVD